MARKKVNHQWIPNESSRRASLKKRRAGLVKKVSELSTLCDVNASLIIYSPDDNQPIIWPSPQQVQENLARFLSIPEMERNKKMVDQESYLKETVSKEEEQLKKQQRKHKEMEVSHLMHHIYQGNGFDQPSLNDFHSLMWFIQEKQNEIKKRIEYCEHGPLYLSSLPLASPSGVPPAHDQAPKSVLDQMAPNIGENIYIGSDRDFHGKATTESTQWDQWFIDLLSNTDNIAGSSSKIQIDHMTGLNDTYQPFATSSSGGNVLGSTDFGYNSYFSGSSDGNQLEVANYGNHPSYIRGSSGTETAMVLHSNGGFTGFMNTDETYMHMSQSQSFSHNGVNNNKNDFTLGLQPHRGLDRSFSGSDMGMALLPSQFEGGGTGSDIPPDLQPFGNVGTSGYGSAGGGHVGLPSEFLGGNSIASLVGLPSDVTKQWPTNFSP